MTKEKVEAATWTNKADSSASIRAKLAPLLMIFCPFLVIILWHMHVHLDGSVLAFVGQVSADGLLPTLYNIWPGVSALDVKMLLSFVVFQIFLYRVLPGKKYTGPITSAGNTPVYYDNGLLAFFVTMAVFVGVPMVYPGLYSPSILYDRMGNLLCFNNLFALGFCLFLMLKGLCLPSSADSGSTGSWLHNYYWGTELYPTIFGINIKFMTNCRLGMMFWPMLLASYAYKSYELNGYLADSMLVSVGIQMIYLTKFYIWESGYTRSMDIMYDRAGFYIVWGILSWLPVVYTGHTLYLVTHPVILGPALACAIFLVGVVSVYVNWDADNQRKVVRETSGKCVIWGSKPKLIDASYVTEKGETKASILLASGWWSVARHFHYVPEILAAFCWCVPAMFTHILPYFYVIFLVILLLDRARRDDARCASKYGAAWQEYKKLVPYLVVPGVF